MTTCSFMPKRAFIRESVLQEDVQQYLLDTKFREKIYMITGIMIASGASSVTGYMKEKGMYAHVGVDATMFTGVPISAGPELGLSSKTENEVSFQDADDFVFAFRVREIKVKKSGEVTDTRFDKGALFSIGGDEEGDGKVDIEIEGLDDEDTAGHDFGMDVKEISTGDDDEDCLCVVPE